MNKVHVIPNMIKDGALSAAKKVCGYFCANGYEVCIDKELKDELAHALPQSVEYLDEDSCYEKCDFIAAIGGDGTLLHAAPKAAEYKKPIIGINNGKLGFMTELSAADELHVLSDIKDGTYFIEERMLLDVSVIDADGTQTVSETLLNDVVVTKGAISRIVDISVYVDGQTTMSFRGDGIIVSTPTGSTGYSLSAGGPIIEPKAKCIAVTPICPHALSIKSFVLDSGREIVIETGEKSESGYISIDGNDHIELAKGGKVVIKKSEKTLAMIRITKQGFYDRINGKLVKEVL